MFVSQIIDEASEILATTDQKKVFRKLTQAVQTLMESGHYFHTQQEVDVCTGWDGQTITLPRGIEVPLGVNIDGSPTYFRGRLFQYHVNKGGMYNPVDWAWDDRGFVATQMDIRQPSQLVAVAEHSADASLQIRVIGTDSNNRELRTQYPDGTSVDGILVPIHAQSDFPYGTIEPDGVTIQTRSVAVTPLSTFISSAVHQLESGQAAILSLDSGTMPSVLVAGNTYFIGVDDANTITLYKTSLDAKAGTNPITLQSIIGSGTIKLTDSRATNLLTSVNLVSAPPITIDSPNPLTFSVGSGSGFAVALPSPLVAGTTYFAQTLDSTNLQVFSSISDAQYGTNPITLTGNSGKFNVDIRKQVSPQTTITFNYKHYYTTGDEVEVYTSGGTLPSPLLAGQKYYVNVISQYTISLHLTKEDAQNSTPTLLVNPITFNDEGYGTNSVVKLLPAVTNTGTTSQVTAAGLQIPSPSQTTTASGIVSVVGSVIGVTITTGGTKYIATPNITFSDPPSPPTGTSQVVATATGYAVMIPDASSSTSYAIGSIVITSAGSGYLTAPTITIDPPPSGGVQAVAVSKMKTSSVSYVTIPTGAGGSGYEFPPIVKFVGGGGTGATGVSSIDSNGSVTSVRIVTQGTGYTAAPNITFTASTGVFVEFSSTGTLPDPLVSGTAYRLEAPLNTSSGTYTIMGADYSEINITSAPTGSFYVALARTFAKITTNGYWSGDFSGISTGQGVYISSDYIIPAGISSNTQYYVRKINNTTGQLFDTAINAIASPSLTGLISITSIGVGQKYYAVRTAAYAKAYNDLLTPESTEYLSNDLLVRFSSTGTLPYPLVSTADYKITLSGKNITLKDTSNNPIVFSSGGIPSLGVGQLSMDIIRTFSPVASTTLDAVNSIFEAGDQITARPNAGDVLPSGIVESTMSVPQYYYTRPNGRDMIELYDTRQHATDTTSTTGRISFYNTGNTLDSTFFVDSILPPILIKTILHVEKPLTEGYVSLYAYDYGRSNDMALVGQYHPSETNPKYRRIRIGKNCSWARVIYRVQHPVITSVYDYIPLENERAIIAAVHACDLEDKDFMEQAQKYWATAVAYLKNQNESMEGHAIQPPQINNITYGDYTDEVMF